MLIRMRFAGSIVIGVVLGVVLCVSEVAAQPAAQPAPWAVGVSEAEQARALAIYKKGNSEFEEQRYAQALVQYRDAITHWGHPAIRFNMAVCLINLDQVLEANDNLELALTYGDAPLGAEIFAQGLTYRKLLLGQLAKLHVITKEKAAEVTLDGKRLLTGPDELTTFVLPGAHQLVATKSGYLTATIPLLLLPGKMTTQKVQLSLFAASKTRLERRWQPWKPWAVSVAGAALVLIALPFQLQASANFASYDREFASSCPTGCGALGQPPIPPSLEKVAATGALENRIALSLFAVGGTIATTGFIGVLLNQPRAVREQPLTVTPRVDAASVSISASGVF